MKITCEEFWKLSLIDLMDQIVIWTGIAVGDSSGSKEASYRSAEGRLQSQLEIRHRLVKSIEDGFTEIARAELITWLQQEGYVEDGTEDRCSFGPVDDCYECRHGFRHGE